MGTGKQVEPVEHFRSIEFGEERQVESGRIDAREAWWLASLEKALTTDMPVKITPRF
jgi:hypothetical protein